MTTREPEEIFDVPKENGGEGSNENIQASASSDTLRILEAVLFASDEILTSSQLKAILPGSPDAKKIRGMEEKINIQLQKERHPFEIVEIGGGYQFRTISYYYPWVKQIFKEKAEKKLSMQALECLAIIAYKQPISKAEIEAIRGVISDGALKTLLEKRLIGVCGRSDKAGHPLLYGTTQNFLKYFGLNKLEDLPRIEEFEAIAKEKMEGLTDEELTQPLKEEELEEVDIEEVATLKSEEKTESKELVSSKEAKREEDKNIISPEEGKLTEETNKEDKVSSEEEAIIEPESEVEIESLKSEKPVLSEEKEEHSNLKEETIFDLETDLEKKEELSSPVDKENIKSEEVVSEEEFDLESKIGGSKEIIEEKTESDKEKVESISQEEKKGSPSQVKCESASGSEEEALDIEVIVEKKEEKKVNEAEEEAIDLEIIKAEGVPEEDNTIKNNNNKSTKKRSKKEQKKKNNLEDDKTKE
ncbi:MAG: SMC-Scp complex subunit ScpB [Chitinispirillaceae bacterium]|nr:SMC-Scp complex subunit ScpB [Chitinispirillaceae bacterium]